MKEIKCPKCGTVISMDDADFASILNQVRTEEFNSELNRRTAEIRKVQQAEEARKAAEDAAKRRHDELFAKLQASAPVPEEEKSRQEQQEIAAKMSEANRKLKDLLTNPTDRKD